MTARCSLKAEAAARGATRYISSKPCSKGHGFERLVVNGACTECARVIRRESYARIPQQRENAKASAARKRKENPIAARRRGIQIHLKSAYGLGEAEYETMLVKQRSCCAICNGTLTSRFDEKLPLWSGGGAVKNHVARVDHCHSTNAVRGLLCSKCNTGLGMFCDSTTNLLKAVRYLDASRTARAQPVAERESVSEIAPGNRYRESSVSRGNRRDELSPF